MALLSRCTSEATRMYPRSKPTLGKPTLARVKVLVACKDFGFGELIVWVF